MEKTSTADERKIRILACAARRTGCSTDGFWKEANELKAAGLIELRETFSPVGERRNRWFLTVPEGAPE